MSEPRTAVAKLSELEPGGMKEVTVDGKKVLLARVGDKCYAVGANCPHYGAPLVDGILSGKRLMCPWHHACFDVTTGRLEEPPAFDGLEKFEVTLEDDQVFVGSSENKPQSKKVDAITHADDPRVFVVLGGGAAGFMAAQTLRDDGYSGRIILITREGRPPYDRPNLSKDYLQGGADPGWMPLRPDGFYQERGIEARYKTEVKRVDAKKKVVAFTDGGQLRYDSMLIATGGTPRRLPFQRDDHQNVFLLRSFSDADALMAEAKDGKRAVVIGSSFIGMEAAASLRSRGCEVTVISPDATPFAKVLGERIGELFKKVHERNGVRFRLGQHVRGFEGDESVTAVVLENGDRLAADLVLVGIGVSPATSFLDGVKLHDDGGVIADEHLSIGDGLYAAGDITHFPDARTGEFTRIEHWRTALQQGRTAAHNMAGKRTAFTGVPFFWTTQFDATLNYVGHVSNWDRIIFEGDVAEGDFLAFYIKDYKVLAVAGMNRDKEMAHFEELIRHNRMYSLNEIISRSAGGSGNASGSYVSANNL